MAAMFFSSKAARALFSSIAFFWAMVSSCWALILSWALFVPLPSPAVLSPGASPLDNLTTTLGASFAAGVWSLTVALIFPEASWLGLASFAATLAAASLWR